MKTCISEGCAGEVKYPAKNSRCNECKRMKDKYGITNPEREEMFREQHGQCKICGDEIIVGKTYQHLDFHKRACVDHCHTTGKVRGLLCQSCNGGLGLFKDNKDRLLSAINYLEEGF